MSHLKNKYIIVPDVHGRKFWKDIIPFVDECKKIIFLGDYHDPYGYEGVTYTDSLENFKEIIKFANKHKDKVTLLLGNHDLTYFTKGNKNWSSYSCRVDYLQFDKVEKVFNSYKHFKICELIKINNKSILFTHAGYNRGWEYAKNNKDRLKTVDDIYKSLTEDFDNNDNEFIRCLKQVAPSRGGYDNVGSIVWCDVSEYGILNDDFEQIVGHSQMFVGYDENNRFVFEPKNMGSITFVDCHKAFYLDDKGDLYDFNTNNKIEF